MIQSISIAQHLLNTLVYEGDFTKAQLRQRLDVDNHSFHIHKSKARRLALELDGQIVYVPRTRLYRFTADWLDEDMGAVREWYLFRLPNMKAQIRNLAHGAEVAVQHLDLRTSVGKQARLVAVTLSALATQLDILDEDD